jgi:hypothetical protein
MWILRRVIRGFRIVKGGKDRVREATDHISPLLFVADIASSQTLNIPQFLTKATSCCLNKTLESNTSPVSLLKKSICKLFLSINFNVA